MSGNLCKRGKTWWGRIQFRGEEHRRSLQTASRALADKRVRQWIDDLRADEWGEKPAPKFEDAVVHFFEVSSELKPSTLCRYQASLRVLDPIFRGLRLSEINREKLREYVALRLETGVAMPTVRRDLAFMSSVMSEAGLHWEFEGNVILSFLKAGRKRGTLRDSEPRTRYLSIPDEQRLLAHCGESLAFAVAFAIDTGLRREEQFGLRWSDIDLADGVVTIGGDRTKTRKTRSVPLLPRSAQLLAQHFPRNAEDCYVFCKPDGTRYPHRRRAYDTAMKSAGIRNLTWHDLRTTCGCRLLQGRELTMDQVRAWLGHSSVAVTERHYAFLSIDDLKAAAQKSAQSAGLRDAG
jgi:integrase